MTRKKHSIVAAAQVSIERLEPRRVFTATNALDQIIFGNSTSEAAHNFDAEPASAALFALGFALAFRRFWRASATLGS